MQIKTLLVMAISMGRLVVLFVFFLFLGALAVGGLFRRQQFRFLA